MCGDDKAPTRAKTDRWRVKQTAKCKVINANYKIHKLILSAEGSSRCLLINIALLSTPHTPPSPTLCMTSVSWFYYSNNKLLTSVIMTSEREREALLTLLQHFVITTTATQLSIKCNIHFKGLAVTIAGSIFTSSTASLIILKLLLQLVQHLHEMSLCGWPIQLIIFSMIMTI